MGSLHKSTKRFFQPASLYLSLIGLVGLVPLILLVIMAGFASFAFQVNNALAGMLLLFIAILFGAALVKYTVFTLTLFFSAGHVVARKKKMRMRDVFRNLRALYWRVFGFTLLAFLLSIPSLILVFFAPIIVMWVGIIFYGLAIIWIIIFGTLVFWTPHFLFTNRLRPALKKSQSFAKKHLRQTITTFLFAAAVGFLFPQIIAMFLTSLNIESAWMYLYWILWNLLSILCVLFSTYYAFTRALYLEKDASQNRDDHKDKHDQKQEK